MKHITAFDLDNTLIYSHKTLPENPKEKIIVEYLDGQPLSGMSEKAWEKLDRLQKQAIFIPVTTRNQQQYQRINFPQTPQYAICANGATLLIDGVKNQQWEKSVRKNLQQTTPHQKIWDIIQPVKTQQWVKKIRDADQFFIYIVAHHADQIPLQWVENLTKKLKPLGWGVSKQGRKIYAVPECLSKAESFKTLTETIKHNQETYTFATGDSVLDAPMLSAADYAIRPSHGELEKIGWEKPGVQKTKQKGYQAGEEILDWMLNQTSINSADLTK